MDFPLDFQISPFAFVSIPLFIVGLTSAYYLVRFKGKTPAIWFMAAILVGIALAMIAMFLTTSLVLWGGAFWPWQEAFVVFCMAVVIVWLYHYPEKEKSLESRLARGFSAAIVLLAFGYSTWFSWQVLVRHNFSVRVHPASPCLTLLALIFALVLAVRRTIIVHCSASGLGPGRIRLAQAFRALFFPDKNARGLRNFCVALLLGLLQALVSGLTLFGFIPMPFDVFGVGLSLLAMEIVLVYSAWDHASRQPSLIVKLVGLSLVTMSAMLGAVGLFNVHSAVLKSEQIRLLETDIAQRAVQANDLRDLPVGLVYIAALTPVSPNPASGDRFQVRMVYERDGSGDPGPLLTEIREQNSGGSLLEPVWGYYYDYYVREGKPLRPVHLYFGSHPPASIYQYAGYTFTTGGKAYEAIFDMAEINAPVHREGLSMTVNVVISSLFILIVYPFFFRASILTPLGNLLRGVRQVNAGDLNIDVPIKHDDEIGFLTRSFNDMAASIRTEIARREEKEEALRELTATLEQQVTSRTRELSVLYEVSAAASQAVDLEALLTSSLSQTIHALPVDMGAVFLLESVQNPLAPPSLRLLVQQGMPPGILSPDAALHVQEGPFQKVIRECEPLLIYDLSTDPRVPAAWKAFGARTLLVAPLRADGRALGALAIVSRLKETFNAEEIALLASIADQVGIAVQSDIHRRQAAMLEERQRLSRDLHDSVTQSLYGLVTLAEAGQARLETGMLGAGKPTLSRIAETARQALNEMRMFVYRLRPLELEQNGLVAAIQQRLAAVEGWSGVSARLLADENLRLSPPVEAALYQIAQEALNNALKHAHPTSITLCLERQGQGVILEIADDGCGFDPSQADGCGFGLRNMSERARAINGTFEIHSQPGEGTKVRVYLS